MRAPPLLLLLLMAAAGLASSPLARLNPWLSACDLVADAGAGADAEAGGERACGGGCGGGGGGGGVLTARAVPRLCALAAGERAHRLAEWRLRACCERSPLSALDRGARADVLLAGGAPCERTLHALLRLDDMVARVHCDFFGILDRYDCGQSYSVHTCQECQETYRRWACSTMVPLWVEERTEGEGEEDTGGARRSRRARAAGGGGGGGGSGGGGAGGAGWHARHLERVGHLDRRRGGGDSLVGRWVRAAAAGPGRPLVRLKPCLNVCQLVEQHCPYFLPADRAPAYPTQYAGEPTFLCLDERIPETGGQANKSNYGGDECCYWHCGGGLCYRCEARLAEEAARPAAESCSPVEERVPTCAVPYQAPVSAAAPLARTPPRAALLAAAAALLLLCRGRPRRTAPAPVPLVNVCDTSL